MHKSSAIFILITLVGSSSLFANDLDILKHEQYKTGDSFLCVGDQTSGLTFRNGSWKNLPLPNNKWLINKVADDAHRICQSERFGSKAGTADSFRNGGGMISRCYKINRMGYVPKFPEHEDWLVYGTCTEAYLGKSSKLDHISCIHMELQMEFHPNGRFILNETKPIDLSHEIDPEPSKNSIIAESGVCSPITR